MKVRLGKNANGVDNLRCFRYNRNINERDYHMKNLTVTRNVQMIDHSATGAKVRELRRKADLTQAQLSAKLGISNSYLSELEKGKRNWSPEILAKLGTLLK